MVGLSLHYSQLVLGTSVFGVIASFLSNLTQSKLDNRSYWVGFCWLFLKNLFRYKNSDLGYRSYWIEFFYSILGPRSYWNGEKCFYHIVPIEGFGHIVRQIPIMKQCNGLL